MNTCSSSERKTTFLKGNPVNYLIHLKFLFNGSYQHFLKQKFGSRNLDVKNQYTENLNEIHSICYLSEPKINQ
jgi:hypothetical protein